MSQFLKALNDLDGWFHHRKRILPWRNLPTLYRVWVSEVMLQQTQVMTVIPYFERFMSRFPTIEDLAGALQEDVLTLWAGLGYYSRARHLYQGAQQIVHQGFFPDTKEEWMKIPGVGRYTAGAILSIALNQSEAILDGNIERVFSRLRRISREFLKSQKKTEWKVRLWRLSQIFIREAGSQKIQPSDFNQALMELGALVCTPRNPACQECPLKNICRSFQRGEQSLYPPKKKKTKWIDLEEEVHCLVQSGQQVLLKKNNRGNGVPAFGIFFRKIQTIFISICVLSG